MREAHTIHLGRWSPFTHEHEAIIQERREWRAARRAERQAAAEELAEVREARSRSRASQRHALRPWGITGRNGIDGGESQ